MNLVRKELVAPSAKKRPKWRAANLEEWTRLPRAQMSANIFRISSEYLQRWRHVFSDSFIIAVDENPNRSKTCPESTHISGAFSEVRRDAGRVCATSRRPLHFGRFFADGATNSLRTALRIHLRRFFGVPKSPDLCPKTCGRRPVFFADSVQSRGIQQIAALNFADSAT